MSGIIDRLNAALTERYTIERELGAGGMATVFLAADLKHDRKVAVKVLKPELAAVLGAERFVVEIKTTAALQHPHILPLFDSGTADGFLFYVMPWIQGETLRAKLDRETQLGVDEAVRIARDVADALDYAHRHGVIHRDIKPENILLHDGRPMVADFGIALAVSAAAGGRMTETGLSLGTPHYMSPEQATAEKEITARSDIYSIGSVLYEMLTGNPPHTGASAQQIIMKIITTPAEPVTVHRKSVPPNVAAAVAKSLEKLPADRFESAKAFADALGNPSFTATGAAQSGGAFAGPASRTARSALIGGVVIALAGIVAAWVLGGRAALREQTGVAVRFPLTLPPDVRPDRGVNATTAISPDGRFLVFAASRGTFTGLFVHSLEDGSTRPIPGSDDGYGPFFSPDGQWVGFMVIAGRQLKKVSLSGGGAVRIAELPTFYRGAAWTMRGDIVLGLANGVMLTVPAAGGTLAVVAPLDSAHGETGQRLPFALDDDQILYQSVRGISAQGTLAVASLSKHTVRSLELPGAAAPLAVIDGQLIYVSVVGGTVMAVPVDASAARVTGTPIAFGGDVQVGGGAVPRAAMSASGSLVFEAGSSESQLVLADMAGRTEIIVPEAKSYSYPRFSPDGKKIAVGVTAATTTDIWSIDLASHTSQRLTSAANNDRPEWTPDGKRIFFQLGGAALSRGHLASLAADGSGALETLQEHPKSGVNEGTISPDGQYLAYRLNGGGVTEDLWYRRLSGDTTSKPIAATEFAEYAPRFSPDGKWVAYASNQSGRPEVYVQPFPALGARFPVTSGGGSTPLWARDGRHIFYVSDARLWVATVQTSPSFAVTERKQLFDGNFVLASQVHAPYDVAPDGQHFLLVKPTGADAQTVVIHDFKYALRERLARAGKR